MIKPDDTEMIIDGILKDCYWEYDMKPEDIRKILDSDDYRLKQKLFEKIIYNSTDRLKTFQIFKKKELRNIFDCQSVLQS